MRLIRSGILATALLGGVAPLGFSQDVPQPQAQQPKPKDFYFSGTVTAIDSASLTATRTGPGKVAATRKFIVTPQTRFEGGKPAVNSRVTVRFVSDAEGDRAIHVIIRSSKK